LADLQITFRSLRGLREYGIAVLAVGAATAISFAIFTRYALIDLVMIYLLSTLVVAGRGHRGPAALSSLLSVVSFDFFFVPPRFSLSIADAEYLFTFGVMFVTAMIISHLTIRLRTESEAARQREMEVEKERMRNALLSSVSHDFRTPLTAIVGSASALLNREEIRSNPKAFELLENIQDEGERLSRQIHNLLEATRLESHAVEVRKELYPLDEIIGNALERLSKSLKNREVAVTIDENLPAIPMDGLLIEQVFTNLLENALRHTPLQTPIKISAVTSDNSVLVSVSDKGRGITPADLERVFEKFYHDRTSPGVGLGLAICRGIVNAHGGRIWAENLAEGGAVFKFTLPMGQTHEA
jgi:two-component system sensor histidine kinase KdpD